MIDRRELMLAGAILLIAVLGFGAEAISDPVAAPAPEITSARHIERGTFCPPPVDEEGTQTRSGIATVGGAGVPIDFEDARTVDEAEAPPPKNAQVKEGAFLLHNGGGAAFNAVAFGARPVGGAIQSWTDPTEGAGATHCADGPSDTWYFPAGSSELGYDERILLYNPFPDEAVARLTFFTPTGPRSKASLDDVAVPSGGWTELEVNKFMNTQKVLSTEVDAVRGRLIAWKVLFAEPEDGTRGASFTLGAPEASPEWFFPQGFLGDGATEILSILNPSEEEVTVTITPFSRDVELGNVEKSEIQLEPETSRDVPLRDLELELDPEVSLAHVSIAVTSAGGTPVIVERSLTVHEGADGRMSEVGITTPSTRWMLPPLAKSASADELVFLNPGQKTARVDASVMTLKGTESPKVLSNMEVTNAGRLEKSLSDLSVEGPFYVVVDSNRPITVERQAQVGSDLADVMGRPVAPQD